MSSQTNGTDTPTTQANGESSAQNGEGSSLENIDAGRLGNLENNWQNLAAAAAAVSNPYGVPVRTVSYIKVVHSSWPRSISRTFHSKLYVSLQWSLQIRELNK